MEKHFFITGTQDELRLLSEWSKVSTPKLWDKEEKFIKTNGYDRVYKFGVYMRIPDCAQIENGKTYSFKNYLKRTDDLKLLEVHKQLRELRYKYLSDEL